MVNCELFEGVCRWFEKRGLNKYARQMAGLAMICKLRHCLLDNKYVPSVFESRSMEFYSSAHRVEYSKVWIFNCNAYKLSLNLRDCIFENKLYHLLTNTKKMIRFITLIFVQCYLENVFYSLANKRDWGILNLTLLDTCELVVKKEKQIV